MRLPLLNWLLFTVVFVWMQPCLAQAPATQDIYLYEDSAKKLTAQTALDLFTKGKFTKTTTNAYNAGFTRSVFWLVYENKSALPQDSLLLHIGHSHINRIHFYYADAKNIWLQWVTGDYFPFSQRPVNATEFYFPINKKGFYLAQIDKSNESLVFSFKLESHLDALIAEGRNKTIMARFTGMIFLLIIFGIYLFAITTDKIYIYYVLYMAAGWLWVLANAGYGFEYLWPQQQWFASKARPIFCLVTLIFSFLFLAGYIGQISNKKISKSIQLLNLVLGTCIVIILLFNAKGYQSDWWLYIQYLIPLICFFYILLLLTVLFKASMRRNKPAMFYLAAISTLLVAGILQISYSLGGLQKFDTFFSNFGLSVGYIMEAIILTAGLVYRFNQYRVDKEKLLIEMNSRQQENTRILMEVQEAERSQVANQLHDVAGSLLSAAKLNLSSLQEKDMMPNAPARILLYKTEEAVSMLSDMVRNLSHALSPVMLEKVGFKTSLEKIMGIVNASGKINTQLIMIGFEKYEARLNPYYTALYSIIYELLNNTVKHSGAKNVLLQVSEHADCFSLMAEDDGLGMEPGLLQQQQSMGISGIRSKVNFFKGSIAFDKNTPQGLIVTIEIPITSHEI